MLKRKIYHNLFCIIIGFSVFSFSGCKRKEDLPRVDMFGITQEDRQILANKLEVLVEGWRVKNLNAVTALMHPDKREVQKVALERTFRVIEEFKPGAFEYANPSINPTRNMDDRSLVFIRGLGVTGTYFRQIDGEWYFELHY